MICSKCTIDKPSTEYYTYYHSTQKEWRTRKVCRSCFNEQKKQYRESIRNKKIIQPVEDMTPIEPIVDYSTNPNYKKCSCCKEYKHLDDYYFHQKKKGIRFADCADCHREKDKKEREEYLKNNGGSDKILRLPNQYVDEYQRHQTFQVMDSLGYNFNEEHGVWLKDGIKSLRDNKPYFHFLKEGNKTTRGRGKKISQLLIDKVLLYRSKGYSMGKISLMTGVSDSSICKIIKKYENK
jgi:hypothetical protein